MRSKCTARTAICCISSCRRSPTSGPTNMAAACENRIRFPLEVFEAVRAAFPQEQAGRHPRVLDRLGRGRLGHPADHRIREGIEEAQCRLDRRFLRRRVAVAENSARPRLSGAVGAGDQGGDRRHHHGGRPDHGSQAGRGDRRVRQGRHGRARPRHALRPALGLARRRRTRRRGQPHPRNTGARSPRRKRRCSARRRSARGSGVPLRSHCAGAIGPVPARGA